MTVSTPLLPPISKPLAAAHISLSQPRQWSTPMMFAVLLAFFTAGAVSSYAVLTYRSSAVAAVSTVPKTVETAKVSEPIHQVDKAISPDTQSGIALTMDSLSSTETAASEPEGEAQKTINLVAEKISDLPVVKAPRNAAHLVEVSSSNSLSPEQMLTKAQAFILTNELPSALSLYDHVLTEDAEDHAGLSGKAFVLTRMGKYQEAVQIGHRLLQRDPDDDAARKNLIAALGASYELSSLEELQRMAVDNVNDAAVHAALAQHFMHAENYAQSVEHLSQAIRLQPENLSYRLALATAYDRAGDSEEALNVYEQVLHAASANSGVSAEAIARRVAFLQDKNVNENPQ